VILEAWMSMPAINPFLPEWNHIDVLRQGRGVGHQSLTGVDDDHIGSRSDGPTSAPVHVVESAIVHKEQGGAELLAAGLETKRTGADVVETFRSSVHEENPVAALAAPDQTALED